MNNFYGNGTASVIIDGQYGSTGKGLLAAYFAFQSTMPRGSVMHTTNAAPNAGHTACWIEDAKEGATEGELKTLLTYHLPTGGVIRNELCYINAGAVVDMALLRKEIANAERVTGRRPMVQIDPDAVILLAEDAENEMSDASKMTGISSTRKGVGSAISRKVRREASFMKDYRIYDPSFSVKVHKQQLERTLKFGRPVSVEVPQGMSLGLNHGGFYPYCTSREVSVSQALSDAGIHPRYLGSVALSMRTFPIRVGSLPGQTSGGYYYDQREMDWAAFGIAPELTTVTQRPRRIFSWSREQYRDALYKALPSVVFLNFWNYFDSVKAFEQHVATMFEDHDMVGHKPAMLYGLGPRVQDVYDDLSEAEVRLMTTIEGKMRAA